MNATSITQFALLDAARVGTALSALKSRFPKQNASLYRGQSGKDLEQFAPYLFWFDPFIDNPNDWFTESGWGQSWGVFLRTKATTETVYRHFRQFLIVQDERGRELYFRFYDPRVLRIFLPTCDAAQLRDFFGPVQSFFMEDEDPAFGLRFWLENGQLMSKRFGRDIIEQELTRGFSQENRL